jgi:hypothetical protein
MRGYKDCIPPFNGSEHLGRLAFEFSNIREFHKFFCGCKCDYSLMCDGIEVKEQKRGQMTATTLMCFSESSPSTLTLASVLRLGDYSWTDNPNAPLHGRLPSFLLWGVGHE